MEKFCPLYARIFVLFLARLERCRNRKKVRRLSSQYTARVISTWITYIQRRAFSRNTPIPEKKNKQKLLCIREALLPLNNRKCRTKKKNEGKSDIRRTGVVGCLFFERLGWGGWEITSARGGALLSPTRPTSSFRPFVLCPPYRSHFYPSRSSSALNVKHGDCKLSSVYSLAPKILFKATNAVVDESNARKWKKKLFCHFIGEIRTVPFENPLTREYHEWTSLISICCN